jgi:hypothetical protein
MSHHRGQSAGLLKPERKALSCSMGDMLCQRGDDGGIAKLSMAFLD